MIHISAPAKINLGLEVIRRRDDGYHDINTLFAAIDICDEIRIQLRDDREIICTVDGDEGLQNEPIENNLCVRAVREARKYLGEERGLTIDLRKHIPTGAGLGGGSSDAAAVLKGALSLWDKDIDPNALLQIALSLGSDVPFFLHRGVAHGSSRGEILQPVEIELPYYCLVVNPGIHIPTPWAYREVNRTKEREESDLVAHIWEGLHDPLSMRRHLVNDFEPPVFAAYPEIGEIKERLYHHGALFALMSGSGSTLFGLFETRERAEKAQEGFEEYWSKVVRFV
ncbi:MAG: 4-(cytidine 5'-diphospho)-2-C-methyl-D-erythritol kinase [Ignavibacteriae bacterium]|nr:4-(cytidine 5'-diphospho)-2-C-methyl-D-erythritol kinase [Ignavibacteriota bacterium]MCB9214397.1 4-(cytidine 5'-diphospho)-2-C-methyl-D-erythritol kinase [Ignavibacteria bacterium]